MKVLHFPLIKITFGFILGIVCTYYWAISQTANYFGLVLSLSLFFLFYYLKKNNDTKTLAFGVLIHLVAFFIGGVTLINNTDSYRQNNYTHCDVAFSAPQEMTLLVRENLKNTKTNERYIALLQTINGIPYSGKIILNISKDNHFKALKVGQYISVKELLYKNKEPNNPNQFDYGAYLNKKQLYAQLYSNTNQIVIGSESKKDIWFYTDQLRTTIKTNLEKNNFSKKELNIAVALLMGQKQEIDPDIMQDYQYAGAIHILSVSGLHVGYLMLFLTFLLNPIPNTKKGTFIKLVLIILTLVAFAIIAGLSPSVLRSVVMFSFVAIGYQLRRSVNVYHTLLVSALLLLFFQPYFLFDIGFQLSYLALYFILWFHPLIEQLFAPKTKIVKYGWTLLSISIAAQIGTLPLSIYYFHQFPGLFFITNLVVAPLLTFIMIVGIIVMFLASIDFVFTVLTVPLELGIYSLNYVIHFVASFEQFLIKDIPFNTFLLLTLYAIIISAILYLKKPAFSKLISVLSLVIILQLGQLYNKFTIQNEQVWIVLNSKKNTIILERNGSKVKMFTNDKLKITDYSSTIVRSYLVANYSQLEAKLKLSNVLYYNHKSVLIIDSTGIYPKQLQPDILLLTNSPKLNLDRVLKTLKPKQVIADATNYTNMQKQWEESCKKQKIPFHAIAEKGFFKLN
ncbi:ComEC/Rec2 family competence protein [Flavobacterium sp. F-380]|jgi:competence protein ComEC|uniref:ComEC/Rec2 family competence protein n=1 Tax=Flavobacterium kayseriense TaxID=2764714 RepID=A0ABR7J5W7_9FLAO|nr:ComEC/Rec2 family competence protein [Flavobacterium kayseriense]MBC5840931.1 ComEC/Rec2 family competence protein [Flavobacterium kayseriense]MBC5846400.1 ComEC/Rec2 family competence protein [Flavobacterium kayseriense]